MPRHRQGHSASRSLWERAGARAGDGAGALFASLDAQDALDALPISPIAGDASPNPASVPSTRDIQARERAATILERLAARIRAGAWNDGIAALIARATHLTDA
jgi:hypothetical protein